MASSTALVQPPPRCRPSLKPSSGLCPSGSASHAKLRLKPHTCGASLPDQCAESRSRHGLDQERMLPGALSPAEEGRGGQLSADWHSATFVDQGQGNPPSLPALTLTPLAGGLRGSYQGGADDTSCHLDRAWLELGLGGLSPIFADVDPVHLSSWDQSDLDRVWLELGLSFADVELPTLEQEPEGVLVVGEEGAHVAAVAAEGLPLADVESAVAAVSDPSVYFANDLRPIVLFDGACNFCSKWTTFLLDHDPLGNLRFASMQSEAGKVLLRRAGMRESDTSEIVLASYNRSYIGAEAILQIFSRLSMPFPIVADLGFVTPVTLNRAVYKLVSKYRHKFGGPSACRLFDPRFNERFVS